MKNDVIIIVGEDDEGHASLIMKNLRRTGISNQVLHFRDGQEILNYLLRENSQSQIVLDGSYVLLLDIRMPKVDGIRVLQQLKQNPKLRSMPVIMVTTTDDPLEIKNCYELGCSSYITKPVNYDKFVDIIQKLGLFLMAMEVPEMNGS